MRCKKNGGAKTDITGVSEGSKRSGFVHIEDLDCRILC
jgi:hypothetical protein